MHFFKLGAPGYFLILAGFALFGIFQAMLHFDVEERLAQREANLAKAPVPLQDVLAEPKENWAYRRVTVRGALFPFVEAFVYVEPTEDGKRGAKNYMAIELRNKPFEYEDDALEPRQPEDAIMADIGYVDWPRPHVRDPDSFEMGARREFDYPKVLTYTGVLIPAQDGSVMESDPDGDKALWDARDVQGMAQRTLLKGVPSIVFFVESPATKGRKLVPRVPDWRPNHLIISVVAFGIAALLALIYVFFGGKGRDDDDVAGARWREISTR